MASHRKPRNRMLASSQNRAAVGLTTAALATLTLINETANAAPKDLSPERAIAEVKEQVDTLYREAALATDRYNGAKEKADKQRGTVADLLDQVAADTQSLNDARRKLGRYAAEQYRTGGLAPTTTLFLAEDPQAYFDQDHLMDRLADGQQTAIKDFTEQQARTAKKRREASRSLKELTAAQKDLARQKSTVQRKLSDARKLLTKLTAEEKARLEALERKKKEEARKRAEELARKEAARKAAEKRETEQAAPGGSASSGAPSGTYAGKAAKAIAFAEAQLGKPYVWGATGPNSFDCSGLTQGAWKAAGVALPRTTWDQVKIGTRVATNELEPGDLVFFYDDISHVGLYIGGGMMIHAPKPGDIVKKAPITEMPIYGNVRPA